MNIGDKVTFTEQLIRHHDKFAPYYFLYTPMVLPRKSDGIYIGRRTVSDGHMNEQGIYVSKRFYDVAIIVTSGCKNPIKVDYINLKIKEIKFYTICRNDYVEYVVTDDYDTAAKILEEKAKYSYNVNKHIGISETYNEYRTRVYWHLHEVQGR